MTAQALRVRDRNDINVASLAAAAVSGQVFQTPSGLAGYLKGLNAAAAGDARRLELWGQVTLPKVPSKVLLDGGEAFWDNTNQRVTFKQTSARDFRIGSFVGDSASADTTCVVSLNEFPEYKHDIKRDAFTATPIGTPAQSVLMQRNGGAHLLTLTSTNEAQKIDALADDGFSTLSKAIVEANLKVVADDSSTHAGFSIGAGSGTHATAFTSITDSIGIQVKAADLKIYAESKTASVTVAATDTTVPYVVGTNFEVWIDLRNPADPQIYIDGVLVLSATVFDVSASAVDWFLIFHLVKTATADTMEVQVNKLRARTMSQGLSGN